MRPHAFIWIVLLCFSKPLTAWHDNDTCVCHLLGELYSCECTEDSIDNFNNNHFNEQLVDLLQKDCFRYYKVDMEKECPFWQSDRSCSSRECGIENCDDEVPPALKYTSRSHAVSSSDGVASTSSRCDESNEIDPLDTTISVGQRKMLHEWTLHDEHMNFYCDEGDESSDSLHYVDLIRNPERYTGYKGNSAQRVWKCIYEENCFKPDPKFDKQYLIYPNMRGMCSEKRMFYRLISGLHTSISISIAANSYKPAPGGFGDGNWYRNVEMFKYRFGPQFTNNEGPERLKNMYYVFLLEIRALQKIAPKLRSSLFYTGNGEDDAKTMTKIQRLVDSVNNFKVHFNESSLFQGNQVNTMTLREEFRLHFRNISRIMDCVDCDKCRLWGKLQTHGIGTALKILFANLTPTVDGQQQQKKKKKAKKRTKLHLERNEVVALFNSVGRFSTSIKEVGEFLKILRA